MFFKIESWNFQVQFEIEFRETLQNFNSIRQPIKKNENKNSLNKLNELKFSEVSRILISNWTWKFQISILKNKKVLFLKKYILSRCQSQNKKALFTGPFSVKVLIRPTVLKCAFQLAFEQKKESDGSRKLFLVSPTY